jgi:hypothetical protein
MICEVEHQILGRTAGVQCSQWRRLTKYCYFTGNLFEMNYLRANVTEDIMCVLYGYVQSLYQSFFSDSRLSYFKPTR